MVDVYKADKKDGKHTHRERLSVAKIRQVVSKMGGEGVFSSFATFPKQVYFETQEDGEAVVLFLRQHPIVNLRWMFVALVLIFMPSLLVVFPPYIALPAAYKMVVVIVWYLLLAGYALANIMHWFYTILIATDERVLDVDLVNLFYREISDTKIDKIQDINSIQSGAWHTFFNMGDVVVQTAGERPEFTFQNVPKPDKVVVVINQLIDLEEAEKIEGRVK